MLLASGKIALDQRNWLWRTFGICGPLVPEGVSSTDTTSTLLCCLPSCLGGRLAGSDLKDSTRLEAPAGDHVGRQAQHYAASHPVRLHRLGDYAGLSVSGEDDAHPVWMDTRHANLFLGPGTGTPTSPPAVCTAAASNAVLANGQDAFTARVQVPTG